MVYQNPKTWVYRDPLTVENMNEWIRDQQVGLKGLIDGIGGAAFAIADGMSSFRTTSDTLEVMGNGLEVMLTVDTGDALAVFFNGIFTIDPITVSFDRFIGVGASVNGVVPYAGRDLSRVSPSFLTGFPGAYVSYLGDLPGGQITVRALWRKGSVDMTSVTCHPELGPAAFGVVRL